MSNQEIENLIDVTLTNTPGGVPINKLRKLLKLLFAAKENAGTAEKLVNSLYNNILRLDSYNKNLEETQALKERIAVLEKALLEKSNPT